MSSRNGCELNETLWIVKAHRATILVICCQLISATNGWRDYKVVDASTESGSNGLNVILNIEKVLVSAQVVCHEKI
jgi:hypothetical protein